MISVKKLVYVCVMACTLWCGLNNKVLADESFSSNPKIVSLVFDDSGSMQGEKEENANYALQALISMLGENDELNIVRMSKPNGRNFLDIQTNDMKQSSIDSVRDWMSAGGTPFDAVDIARDWLYERKEQVGNSAEYWLIIITDGEFNFYQNGEKEIDMYQYMDNINNNFTGMKFESILLNIGNELQENFVNVFKVTPNCSVQEAKTAKDIVNSMFEISSRINSGLNIQDLDVKKVNSNEIVLNLELPIYKMNIFIQKNGLEITNIESENSTNIEIVAYNIETDKKSAKMNEITSDRGFLKQGKYTITFNDEVDLDLAQVKIYVQVAVKNVLKLYKRDGKNDVELSDVDYYSLKSNESIIAKSELISLIDGVAIDISALKGLDGFYYINDKKSYGKFEGTKLVTEIILEPENNTIYSLLESKGLINAKSNVVVIDFTNLDQILVQYTNSDAFEKVDEISLNEVNGSADVTINNLPEGVIIEYENVEYSNGQKILLNEDNRNLIVKANKNYKETSFKIVEIEINSNDEGLKKFLKVTPKTPEYRYVKVDKNQNSIDMGDGLLKLKIEYKEGDKVIEADVENIKKIKFDNISKGYDINATLNEETNEVILKFTPNIFSIFAERKIDFSISSEMKGDLGSADAYFCFDIENYNLLKVLMLYIWLLVLLIILFGYLFKHRFARGACVTISNETSPYSLRECMAGVKRFLPFVADTVKLPNVEFKAKSGKRIELVSALEEIVEVNGDTDIPAKIILSINNGEFVLKDGIQKVKYEYVSLTPDEIIEASEEKENNDVNWF